MHACEREFRWLDMAINFFKKSCCLRIGPRNDVVCAKIASLSGCVLPWVLETSYLGVDIVNSKSFKCSIDAAKRTFYRSAKDQIPLRYLVADRFEAGRGPLADLLARASSLLAS